VLVGMDLVPPLAEVIGASASAGLLVLIAGDNTCCFAPPLITDEAHAAPVASRIIDQVRAAS